MDRRYLSASVTAFDFRKLCANVTHPLAPLERGDWNAVFLFGNERFMAWWLPLSRGDEGVCYGEKRGKGRGVAM